MKFVLPLFFIVLGSVCANAAAFDLNSQQSAAMAKLIKSSGAEEVLDGASTTIQASDLSCTLERSLGVSCVWKVTKANSHEVIEQELSEKKSEQLYKLLKTSGLEEILDGRTSSFNASAVECAQERFVALSCVVVK